VTNLITLRVLYSCKVLYNLRPSSLISSVWKELGWFTARDLGRSWDLNGIDCRVQSSRDNDDDDCVIRSRCHCLGLYSRGFRQTPYDKIPSCDKTPLKVNYLRFTVNVVKEKDGSTVHGVFYFHLRHTKSHDMYAPF